MLYRLRGKDPQAAAHVRQWLRPVWDLLGFADDERDWVSRAVHRRLGAG